MITTLTTLLRLFYWVTVPTYLFLYVLAMRADSRAAFWIEGGTSVYGPYSFYALMLLWSVPALIGSMLSIAGQNGVLSRCMSVALIFSAPCIPGLLFSSQGGAVMIVPHLGDYLDAGFFIAMFSCIIAFGIILILYFTGEELFESIREVEAQAKYLEILKSYKLDNEQLWLEQQELRGNHDKLKMLLNEFSTGAYPSSSDFFGLLKITAGRISHQSRLSDVNSDTISKLRELLFEYKLGRFTSLPEFEAFRNKYYSDSISPYADESARKLTHPLLIKMYNADGALRARAIEISNNKPLATEPTTGSSPPPPTTAPNAGLAISRNGQVIMQEVSRQDVQIMLRQGVLLITDYYWAKGMSTWLPLSDLSSQATTPIDKPNERSVGSALLSLLVSWIITVLIGVIILGLIGYGNSGAEGASRLIGTYIGLLIFVRPIFLIVEIISRAIMGKRGVDLLSP